MADNLLDELLEHIEKLLEPIKADLHSMKHDVQELKAGQRRIEEKLTAEVESLAAFNRKVDEVIEDHRTRIEKLEAARELAKPKN